MNSIWEYNLSNLNKMKEIEVNITNLKPNLRIIKNYFIIFERNVIKLFDLNGNILDNIKFENIKIVNIEISNDNFIIVAFSYTILILKIKDKYLILHDTIRMTIEEKIDNIFNIKNLNLFIVSCENKMKIYDINNANEKLIQIINNKADSFLNFNQNIFISYNNEYISLYHNIKGNKMYQLSSKLKLVGKKSITKLNKKILLVFLDNTKLYKINIINMNIEEIDISFIMMKLKLVWIICGFPKDNAFIYSNKKNIYIYICFNLYYIKYINNKFEFIGTFHFSQLNAINYLSNKYIKLSNIIINCINKVFDDIYYYDDFNNYINDNINYCRPKIDSNSKKELNILLEPTKKRKSIEKNQKIFINNKKKRKKKKKNKFINLYSKNIVNHPNRFKKNYR